LTLAASLFYTEKTEIAMEILLTLLHVLVCVFLIVVVLLQSGKAADLAGAFGGMGSQTAFGPRGSATLLSKATTVSAVIFMLTSMTLSIIATRAGGPSPGTVLEGQGTTQTAPAVPGQPPAQPQQPGDQPPAPAP
jgi:preprotein translocase subunit SecG